MYFDGEVCHAGKWRETFERFFPKLSVRLVELWPDGQRLQRPRRQMAHECFDLTLELSLFGI